MTIPKLVHYVWVGPTPLPDINRKMIAGWKTLLPDYDFILWDEGNIDFTPKFVRQAHGVRAYNRVANYARLAALQLHGGFYMDHDVELLKSLDPLRGDHCIFGFQSMKPNSEINSAFIGAIPNHPFIVRILNELNQMDGTYDWGSKTGPGLITRLLRESDGVLPSNEPYIASDVTLYPPRYFYPFEWDAKFSPECIKEDTYTVHHWAHSWATSSAITARLKRGCRRVLTRLAPSYISMSVRRADVRKRRKLQLFQRLAS